MKEIFNWVEKNWKMFYFFEELVDKYLYDFNLFMCNEEFYILVLEVLIVFFVLDEMVKICLQVWLELVQKNWLGIKVFNFIYILDLGVKGMFYQFFVEYILLFINNLGCYVCVEMIEGLKVFLVINGFIVVKKLKVLFIYLDEELDEWKKYCNDFVKEWINGYDKELVIKNKNLYDLRVIFIFYLLDKNKIVLLKDVIL